MAMGSSLIGSTGSRCDFTVLWAKSSPRHPLWKHLLDAAAVSLSLPSLPADDIWTRSALSFIVGLHDIGKADAPFQHQIREFSDELVVAGFPATADARVRHERISARFIKDTLIAQGVDCLVAETMARSVVAHHGNWEEGARGVAQAYACAQDSLCEMLMTALSIHGLPTEQHPNLSALGVRLAGRVVLCDWIASNEAFFEDSRLQGVEEPNAYLAAARQVSQEWIDRLHLARAPHSAQPEAIVDLPRPLQSTLLKRAIPPSLVIIEAPMGEGKTEAAWILAEKWRSEGCRGMYMALPTMATSESLHHRYQVDYLERLQLGEDARLVHGMAWLRDEDEPSTTPVVGTSKEESDAAASWFRPTRRAMLAAHGVGTVDQAMLAGMNVKFGLLRLFGLAGRVLIIDELHAYDAYMSEIIARLLQWCSSLEIPVILLSATLSSDQRSAMVKAYGAMLRTTRVDSPYPLITVAERMEEPKEIAVSASSRRTLRIRSLPALLGEAVGTACLVRDLVEDGGCCCVIANTVRQAQAIYRALDLPDDERLLFHARFTASDRSRIAGEVLKRFGKDTSQRPDRFVLVATQVVEQSLDVDFDHMVSEIAPIDLLLQRSGRLHRHNERTEDPVLTVLLPENGSVKFGGTGYVYARKPLLRTLALLTDCHEVRLPDQFRELIEGCYGNAEWEQDAVPWDVIRRADQEWDEEVNRLINRARQFVLQKPRERAFRPVRNDPVGDDSDDGNGWRASTRLGAIDRTAILVRYEEVPCLETGEIPLAEVRSLYRRSLRLPGYLPIGSPVDDFYPGVMARGRLHGIVLLPISKSGEWRGINERGVVYRAIYDQHLGLQVGRVE